MIHHHFSNQGFIFDREKITWLYLFMNNQRLYAFLLHHHDLYSFQSHIRILADHNMSQLTSSLKEQRKQSFTSSFATISFILSIGHFIVLGNSISFAQKYNDWATANFRWYIDKTFVHLNIPFASEVALLATVQLLSSLAILSFNRKPEMTTYMHYASSLALLSSFAVSATICTTAFYYNQQIATQPKIPTSFPSAQGFYRWMEIDAAANCLLSVPFLFYIFYNNIQSHLARQKINIQPLIKSHNWILILLVNVASHAIFAILIYSYIEGQDTVNNNYVVQTQLSCYTFFLVIEIAVSFWVFIALNLTFQPLPFGKSELFKTWMSPKQLIVATTVPILFSFTVIMMIANKGSQLAIDKTVYGDKCLLSMSCNNQNALMVQCFCFLGLTLGTLAVLIVKFRDFSRNADSEEVTQKLLTNQYGEM